MALLANMAGAAEPAHERHMMIAIDDGSDNQVLVELDDSQSAISMHDMQLGESRSLVDEQGRSVLVTRTEDGLEFNVDGKVVEVPVFENSIHGSATATLIAGATDMDVDIEMASTTAVHVGGMLGDDKVTIISGAAIDPATRDSIKAILTSAGHTGDVVFIDREAHAADNDSVANVHEARRVKVISREVNATN